MPDADEIADDPGRPLSRDERINVRAFLEEERNRKWLAKKARIFFTRLAAVITAGAALAGVLNMLWGLRK